MKGFEVKVNLKIDFFFSRMLWSSFGEVLFLGIYKNIVFIGVVFFLDIFGLFKFERYYCLNNLGNFLFYWKIKLIINFIILISNFGKYNL